jgi:hypothetical protein
VSTGALSIQKKLRLLGKSSTTSGDAKSPESIRGPLGMTLLHEPSEPRIDFIFVHGLRGGSRKSWSFSPDPAHFWPKEWLPNETGFEHVRVHSWGYDSDWTLRKASRLTVHDFGQALLADIHNAPALRENGEVSQMLSVLTVTERTTECLIVQRCRWSS